MDEEKLKDMCESISISLDSFAERDFANEKHKQTYKDFLEFSILNKLEDINDANVLAKVLTYADDDSETVMLKFYRLEMIHLVKFVVDVCKMNEDLKDLLYLVEHEVYESLYELLENDADMCQQLLFLDFYQNEVDDDLKNVDFTNTSDEPKTVLLVDGHEC